MEPMDEGELIRKEHGSVSAHAALGYCEGTIRAVLASIETGAIDQEIERRINIRCLQRALSVVAEYDREQAEAAAEWAVVEKEFGVE